MKALVQLFALLFVALLLQPTPAEALPSFARQTGLECTACHVSWPELTPLGRRFKLTGYTLARPVTGPQPVVSFSQDDQRPVLPIAAFAQITATHTASVSGADSAAFPADSRPILEQASLFYGGRIADNLGAFIQWTYDGLAHHSASDNTDIRYAETFDLAGTEVIAGLDVNNAPTVSDVFNTTPIWRYPYIGSSVALTPAASPLIEGALAQQVLGFGGYTLVDNSWYAELQAYKSGVGALGIFSAGQDPQSAPALKGIAPYARLAYQHEWAEGAQSLEFGAFDLALDQYLQPAGLNPGGPTDHFNDLGFDAQYQYITDRHRFTVQASTIREDQDLGATFGSGGSSNPNNRLRSNHAKFSYIFDRVYGVSLGAFSVQGTTDPLLYAPAPLTGSRTGSPNSSGSVLELDWLVERDRRLFVQYTNYRRFNGASSNYDGFGRSAADNNTLFVGAWLAF